jgi:cytochrome c-type biogenesis protein CcmH/NrfG
MMPYNNKNSGLGSWYEKLARAAFYFLVFLVPLAYFPWTVDSLEFNKQTVMFIFTSISVIAWLGHMLARKSFVLKSSGLFIMVGVFLASAAISCLLSISPYVSWIGHSQQEYTSFLTLVCLGLLLFIGSTFLSETDSQKIVWTLSLMASAIIGTFVSLTTIGLTLVPTSFIGTPNALGFYLVAMASMGCGLLLVAGKGDRDHVLFQGFWGWVLRVSSIVTILSALIILLALDYWLLWVAMIIGLCATLAFTFIKGEDFPSTSAFVLPMGLMICSLVFLGLPSPLSGRIPGEVAPTYAASWNVAKQAIGDSSFLFGSGPGTFVMDYTKFRLASVNETSLWDARFDRSASAALTMLATFGVLGALLFLIVIFWVAGSAINQLLKTRECAEWKMTYIAFSGWLVLAIGFFVYSWNFTLTFLFFLLSAIITAQSSAPMKVIDFAKSPRLSLATAFSFVLSSVGLLTILFVSLSRYGAEIAFAKAVAKDDAGGSIDEVIADLNTAVSLNRWQDAYYRNLANAQLIKLGEISADPSVKAADVQALVAGSINSARRSVDLSPAQVANWSLLGDIYREVAPIVTGADKFAVQSYQTAIELAPSNPKYFVALGRAYLTQADLQGALLQSEDPATASRAKTDRDAALGSAVVNLQKAIELKENFAPAHYYLAAAYERQGNLSEAIARMESLAQVSRGDVGVAFQLGMLYLRQGKVDQAQIELERAVSIVPNYSNALWFLSAVYEQQGDFAKAIETVKKVEKYNSGNDAVRQRLERLESGKAESELPAPLEDSVEESVTQ